MANVNINFTADSAKVENAIRNIDKEIQKVIAGSTSLEQSFNSALGKSSANFAELTQKVNGLGTAFEKMRGGTQLANLAQASTVAGGAINTLIMELQGLNGASEENTQKIAQMIVSLGLNENSINQVTQVYQRYIQSLAVGSQAHTQAIAQLQLFQNAQQQLGATTAMASAGNGQLRNAVSQLGYTLGDASMFAVNFRMGMMSIANNIPMIAQGFAQARASGLSWGAMLRQSVTGVNGFMLGLNALMLAVQILPPIFEKLKGAMAETKKKIAEVNDEYIKSYATHVAQAKVAIELSKIVADGNAKMQDRKNALGQIQEKYPDYLKNVDLEKTKAGDLNKLIADGNNLLMVRAEIMARSSRLTSLYSAKLEADQKFEKERFEINWGESQQRENRLKQLAERQKASDTHFELAIKGETDAITALQKKLPKDAYVPSSSGSGSKIDSADERDKKIAEKYLYEKLSTWEEDKAKAENVLSEQLANNLISQENYDLEKKRLDKKFIDEQKKVYDEFIEKHGKKITEKFRDSITLRSEQLGTDSNLAQAAINAEQAKFNKALVEKVTDAGKNVDLTGIEDGSFTENLLTKMAESKAVSEQFNKTFPEYKDFSAIDWTTIGKTESELQNFPAYIAWKFKTALEKGVKDEQAKLQLKMIDDTNATSKKLNEYKVYDDPYKLKMVQLQQNKDSDIMKLAQNTNQRVEFYKAVGADESFIKNIKLQFLQDSLEITKYYAKLEDDAKEENAQKDRDRMKETLEFAKGAFREHTAAYKLMAIAQATIDMWSAWQRALLLPPIWKEIEQALILASGAANIARIAGVPGFAKGGIINSPTLGLVGEAGPEIIAPVSDYAKGQAALIQAVKQDMIINSVSNNNLRLKIKGSDLLIVSDKANTKQNGRKLGGLNYA